MGGPEPRSAGLPVLNPRDTGRQKPGCVKAEREKTTPIELGPGRALTREEDAGRDKAGRRSSTDLAQAEFPCG